MAQSQYKQALVGIATFDIAIIILDGNAEKKTVHFSGGLSNTNVKKFFVHMNVYNSKPCV